MIGANTMRTVGGVLALGLAVAAATGVAAQGIELDLEPDHMENGRWYNAEGLPTFKVENGVVDYATFSGYRRYHSECHVCHGPDGEGSTYAPALKDSVTKRMDYWEFMEIAASGKQDVNTAANLVMPAFGTNRNAWCYIDDIYVYLLARGTGAIPRGRPAEKEAKSDEFAAQEASCMEG
ncbi:c-type cytochrome, methanol metabolism-related [Paracoccus sp. SJTW-4]|uniref:c-type cytochrome, methanol metabolism-related n=1 Tax=Paracoccus sp. SJTW-4 TaxID=3078428 RepID=UPI0039ECEBE0